MSRKYVPIVKCKMGEQKALLNLDDTVKDSVIPLIEIPLFTQAMIKKGATVDSVIASFWGNRKFYFYFMPDWYSDYDDFNEFLVEKIKPLCKNANAIPVIDLSLVDYVNDWTDISANGVTIRIRNNEFGDIEDILNQLFNDTILQRKKTNLLFDLQYISENDLFSKTSMIKAAFSDLEKANEFESIIISCASFPKQFTSIESRKIYRFKRIENEIFANALKLSERFNFNYVYSDYGPSDIAENGFVIGMSPNFKIKYTAFDDYLFIKGIQIKKGGLDIENVQALAKILIECSEYSGDYYSWGDKNIYDIARGILKSSGNLTTWVAYAMNHHITFITDQI